ncbi:NADP-dependent oxidoreductase domain-containing protein [Gongronella butleri]|nr:NADP-dependent oxidoreductase domain-containing protein [Gongronella butleri]
MSQSSVPSIKLNNGKVIPSIGLGAWGGRDAPAQVYEATKVALKAGYRHFDTAYSYGTEEAIGNAIRESDVAREDIFVTTKLSEPFHEPQHVAPVLEESLKNLQTDYVDLFLIHWPFATEFRGYKAEFKTQGNVLKDVPVIDTWRAMEQLVRDGKVKSIGVSNFTIPLLEDLLAKCSIPPAVNQVELHPFLPQQDLVDYCKEKGIALTAYSPLGNPSMASMFFGQDINILEEPKIKELAKKYNVQPGQVVLNWGLNRGYAVIPKSTTPNRIRDNLVTFKMEKEDIDAITNISNGNPIRIVDPAKIFGPAFKVF